MDQTNQIDKMDQTDREGLCGTYLALIGLGLVAVSHVVRNSCILQPVQNDTGLT